MRNSKNTDPVVSDDEKLVEQKLRPSSFDEFTGQKKITDNLKVFIGAAKKR
ncbi:MAG: Holliday junction branch migration DNA helicase RuvB, partial [Melioribacteraceae bacterium]